MKALLRYPGSKWSIAEWIISHFPEGYEKMVYLEPFVGSGAVFFNKNPGVCETINDLDGDIVNLFWVIRNHPAELERALFLTPYSREEYDRSFSESDDPIEQARRYVVRTTQAIGAKMNGKCGWRNHKQPKLGGTACKWNGIPEMVVPFAQRLKGSAANLVQIENMDAIRLIERYDFPEVLMYLDPPYVLSSRKSGKLYRHEMSDAEQAKLLDTVTKSRAKIIISGYPSEMYGNALKGWRVDSTMSQTTSTEMAREYIWMNYDPPRHQLTMEEFTGKDENYG